MIRRRIAMSAAAVVTLALCVFADSIDKMPFPAGYRTWTVTKTLLIGPQHKTFETRGGFHHYYANEKAMEGFRTGRFPEGSVVIDEGVAAEEKDGAMLEGAKRSLAVMMKDSQRYRETGGWGFDVFAGDSQTASASAEAKMACFNCHAQKKDHDMVFSEFRQ